MNACPVYRGERRDIKPSEKNKKKTPCTAKRGKMKQIHAKLRVK
jgi:hypothetical protein